MALNQGKVCLAMMDAPKAARCARAFHWPLEFPDVMQRGGFDVVLVNPPCERIKLQERDFFAALSPEIANATNKAARDRLVKALEKAAPGSADRALFDCRTVIRTERARPAGVTPPPEPFRLIYVMDLALRDWQVWA